MIDPVVNAKRIDAQREPVADMLTFMRSRIMEVKYQAMPQPRVTRRRRGTMDVADARARMNALLS